MVQKDSSVVQFDRAEIAFILALFHWPKQLANKGEEKTSEDELQKIPHT